MTMRRVWFSSNQKVTCHLEGCHHIDRIPSRQRVAANVSVTATGRLPYRIATRLCTDCQKTLKGISTRRRRRIRKHSRRK